MSGVPAGADVWVLRFWPPATGPISLTNLQLTRGVLAPRNRRTRERSRGIAPVSPRSGARETVRRDRHRAGGLPAPLLPPPPRRQPSESGTSGNTFVATATITPDGFASAIRSGNSDFTRSNGGKLSAISCELVAFFTSPVQPVLLPAPAPRRLLGPAPLRRELPHTTGRR